MSPGDAARDHDATLLARISKGDEDAFATLYRGYQKRLFGYLFRLVRDAGSAEELVDDVLLEVWRGAARFQGQSRVSTWIFGIAHHKALNVLRRKSVQTEEPSFDIADPADPADLTVVREDLRARLAQSLTSLSPAQREVVELTLTEGFSVDEIAAIVGCASGTVKSRMFHARRVLRATLTDRGFSAESI